MTTFDITTPLHGTARPKTAALLRAGSMALARLARRLEGRAWLRLCAGEKRLERSLEFQADVGSIGGSLFVDGAFVGRLPVDRL